MNLPGGTSACAGKAVDVRELLAAEERRGQVALEGGGGLGRVVVVELEQPLEKAVA